MAAHHRIPRSTRGYSLLELTLSLGIGSVMLLSMGSALEFVVSNGKTVSIGHELDKNKTTLFSILSQPENLGAVLLHPDNLATTVCLDSDAIDCVNAWQPLKVFEVARDANNDVAAFRDVPFTDDPIAPNVRGFSVTGAECTEYSLAGSATCPFRYRVEWKPACTATCREPRSIEIRATLEYAPVANAGISLNIAARSFSITYPIPRNPIVRISSSADINDVCALYQDGTAKCWGDNYHGALGVNQPTGTDQWRPQFVKGFDGIRRLQGIVSIANASNGTRCVLLKNKRVACWGENMFGMLGLGKVGYKADQSGLTHTTHPIDWVHHPNGVGYLENVDEVYDGGENTICARSGSEIYCWGNVDWDASFCDLNTDATTSSEYYGIAIPAYSFGSLVDSSMTFTGLPNLLKSMPFATQIASSKFGASVDPVRGCTVPATWSRFYKGSRMSCFITGPDSQAMCWGANSDGQLGAAPSAGALLAPTDDYFIPEVGAQHTDFFAPVGSKPNPLKNIIDIELNGQSSACAILKDRTGVCWGSMASAFQDRPFGPMLPFGDHSLDAHLYPSYPPGSLSTWEAEGRRVLAGFQKPQFIVNSAGTGPMTEIKDIEMSYTHGCLLRMDGTVYCWGANGQKQLGPAPVDRSLPIKQNLPAPATQIQLGFHFTCALLNNAKVYCWGCNGNLEMGADPETGVGHLPASRPDPKRVGRL